MPETSKSPTRVAVFQPALPKYRVPIFRCLAESFELKVFYGKERYLSNVQADGFKHCPVNDYKIKLPGGQEFMWSRAQITACGDRSWDVIVLPWNIRYLSLFLALSRARLNGIPTILWGHGYSKKPGFIRSWLRNRITSLASAVLFYDPLTSEAFAKLTGRRNCFAAPNTIDTEPIRRYSQTWSDESRLDRFRKQHDLVDREIVLFVSRFDPNNRLELLIHAVHEIKTDRPNILAVLIGDGQDDQHLRSLVKELNCEQWVRFTGPIYEEEQLAPWFLSASLFCYPSNVGLSLIHAFNYGLPVVVGDDLTRCNPEIYAFENGSNGLTFKDESSIDLAKCIAKLLADQNTLSNLRKGAIETATNRTTLEKYVSGYAEALRFAAQSSKQK